MKIFLTGASGYIGGSVAEKLRDCGHEVCGLVRSEEKAAQLRGRGIEPVLGSLDDASVLREAARSVDAVIDTASSDHRWAAETFVEALAGTGKTLIHTSGSSIVADRALGEFSECVYDEENRREPEPERAVRVAVDRLLLDASRHRNIRSIIICPSLIYGRGRGLHTESLQLPLLIGQARKSGVARYVGRGLNLWSNVHIDDVVDLYLLALERAAAGSFFFAENGEASFKEIAEAISLGLGLGQAAETWTLEQAVPAWGYERTVMSLASNSRVRAVAARQTLGWQPQRANLLDLLASPSS